MYITKSYIINMAALSQSRLLKTIIAVVLFSSIIYITYSIQIGHTASVAITSNNFNLSNLSSSYNIKDNLVLQNESINTVVNPRNGTNTSKLIADPTFSPPGCFKSYGGISYWYCYVEMNVSSNYDGTATSSPGGSTSTSDTYELYAGNFYYVSPSYSVDISESPSTGYEFVDWTCSGSGCYSGTATSKSLSGLGSSIEETAHFKLIPETLTMNVNPSNDGSTSPGVGSHTYGYGTTVSLSETPATGYEFVDWTCNGNGCYSGTSTNPTVTLKNSITETANFKLIPETLTMNMNPSSGGSISPSVGNYIYNYGTVITITESPSTGYEFTGWTGSGSGSYTGNKSVSSVTMDSAITETANFKLIPETLTMNVNPSSGGTTSPSVGTYTYNYGTSITISETPNPGYTFYDWTCGGYDCYSGTSQSATIKSNNSISETANYEVNLTMEVSPTGTGSTTPSIGIHPYAYGTSVLISETPAKYYEFVKWIGSTNSSYSGNATSTYITLNYPTTEEAVFKVIPLVLYTPSVSASSIEDGQSETITEKLSGGLPNYTYIANIYWYNTSDNAYVKVNSTKIITSNSSSSVTFYSEYYPLGKYKVNYTVTDSESPPVTEISGSNYFEVTLPMSVEIKPEYASYDAGESITLNAIVSGGTSPYSYKWYNNTSGSPSVMSSYTSNSITLSTSNVKSNSTFEYFVNVTDSASSPQTIESKISHINVFYPGLSKPNFTVLPSNNILGVETYPEYTNISFNASGVSGGDPPYTYSFSIYRNSTSGKVLYVSKSVVSSSSFYNISYNFTSTGNYTANVSVSDSATVPEVQSSKTIKINIYSAYGGIVGPAPLTCPKNVKLTPGTTTISGSQTLYSSQCYYNLTVDSGATLTLLSGVNITVLNTFTNNGVITSSGEGESGYSTSNGYGNNGNADYQSYAGGEGGTAVDYNSYDAIDIGATAIGGAGGNGPSIKHANYVHSGNGNLSNGGNYSGAGGAGTGWGTLTGGKPPGFGGSGAAGGFIEIKALNFLNNGKIESNGAEGTPYNVTGAEECVPFTSICAKQISEGEGGGGSGGEILLVAESNSISDVNIGNVEAEGGNTDSLTCGTSGVYYAASGSGGGGGVVIVEARSSVKNGEGSSLTSGINVNGGTAGSVTDQDSTYCYKYGNGNDGTKGNVYTSTLALMAYVPKICRGPAPNGTGLPTLNDGYCYFNESVVTTTQYSDGLSGSLSVTDSEPPSESPSSANAIKNSFSDAGWLITCPNAPQPGDVIEYFMSNKNSYIGGDECLTNNTPSVDGVGLSTFVEWTNSTPAFANVSIYISNDTPTIRNLGYIGEVNYTDIPASSPFSNLNSNEYIISNGYNSQSYMFDSVPDSPEAGIWSWDIKLPDVSSVSISKPISHTLTNLYYYNETGDKGIEDCNITYDYSENATLNNIRNAYIPIPGNVTPKPTVESYFNNSGFYWKVPSVSKSSAFSSGLAYVSCAYYLYQGSSSSTLCPSGSYSLVTNKADFYLNTSGYRTTSDGISLSHNLFLYTSSSGSYYLMSVESSTKGGLDGVLGYTYYTFETPATQPFTDVNATVLPYLLYNISMPATTSDVSGRSELMNLSFDLYSPYNYMTPSGHLDPFNLTTGSGFFATYNETTSSTSHQLVLAQYPSNSIHSSSSSTFDNPDTQFTLSLTQAQRTSNANLSSFLSGVISAIGGSTVGSFLGTGFPNPAFIGESPDDYIYAINYTHTSGWLDFNSKTTTDLAELRYIPKGYYNMLNIQPSEIANERESNLSSWDNAWAVFWNDSLLEQAHNLFITDVIPISNYTTSWFGALNGNTNKEVFQYFVPTSMVTDYAGDIFVVGKFTAPKSIWGDIVNVFDSGASGQFELAAVYSNGTAKSEVDPITSGQSFEPTSEMAVAPGGQYIYLANSSYGYIPFYSGSSLKPAGYQIDTSYNTSTTMFNITSYLAHGGPFDNSTIASFYKGMPAAYDNDSNHHIYGLGEAGGLLYVLDLWNFTINGNSSSILMLQAYNDNGTQVPINPSAYNNMVVDPGQIAPTPITGINNETEYPPYGWPLAANISVGNSGYITYCVADCNYTPSNMKLSQTNGYPPIGPKISAYGLPSGMFPHDFGFSTDFNGTINLLIHDSVLELCTDYSDAGDGQAIPYSYQCPEPVYNEFLTFKMNINNYTEVSLGENSPWNCFINQSEPNLPTQCVIDSNLNKMYAPIEEVPSSFKYIQNEGSPGKFLSISTSFSSIYPNSTKSSQGNSTDVTNPGNGLNNSANASKISAPTYVLSEKSINLTSHIGGYIMIPYYVNYTLTQNYTMVKYSGTACSTTGALPSNSSKTYTYFSAADVPAHSEYVNSTIEGGPTYGEYAYNNEYYTSSVYDNSSIIPPNVLLEMFTNRLFGSAAVNYTTRGSNYIVQDPLNESLAFNYTNETINQSVGNNNYPGYQIIGVIPKKISYTDQTNVPMVFENETSNIGISLFDVYKIDRYTDTISLPLSGMTKLRGYNRLIYTFKDVFNNTIYMPVDVDISNTTSISLNVEPNLNPINSNETNITVSGVATYSNGSVDSLEYLPKGSLIYIYYNRNINFYNATDVNNQDPSSVSNPAAYLAYGNECTVNPTMSGCRLAQPLDKLQQGNGVAEANLTAFNTQYNSTSSNTCSPEPKSLLEKTNYTCNIYGAYGLPKSGTDVRGNVEYCNPIFTNGTGMLTSEEGLVNIVKVGSNGQFNDSFNTCGTGDAKIIAEYYGASGPEPISINQPSMSHSVEFDGNIPSEYVKSYYEYNYTYSPYSSSQTINIGNFSLAFNGVNAVYSMALLSAFIVAAMIYKRRRIAQN
ncbi:cell surface protein [Candidatus Mancarchaeum acidiphilum]|uniref:Cell surface protein n=1 Tax=Candidatus Mancarchaeum acidiphilum TaxID=1920749 RepID=A0A218NLZ8_9ARCH|nr:hypothetical protein [Candidatus Mancarchaeum acidiphilum]ASI13489.1 cell surface protein [Candidatus Mancarchaeum acidiphilum]